MDSDKLQQNLKTVEMVFILIFGGVHLFAPFISSSSGFLPAHEEVFWPIVPMAILSGGLCIAYIVTKGKIQQIFKWISIIMFAGGSITHFLYVFGVMPSWFIAMPILSALFGGIMDAIVVIAIYDYGRRVSQ